MIPGEIFSQAAAFKDDGFYKDQWLSTNSYRTSTSLSRSAGSYFHLCAACANTSTSTGLPPSSLTLTTLPSELTVSRTRAMHSIFILRASSGYSGGGLDFALRVLCVCGVSENAGDMA